MPWESTGVVAPGKIHTYTWEVPERAGPGPLDPSSVVWLYHSHVAEPRDVNAGLVGAIIITRRGMARPDGTPKDIDREFVALYMAFNENQSWYLDHNIQTYTTDPKGVKMDEEIPLDEQGHFMLTGSGFVDTAIKWSMNGYIFGNMPMMTMKRGQRVRWYLVTIGDGVNFHTPHWHGNVVIAAGQQTDVVSISPAQMLTADMVPDKAGTWMFHCHVSDHLAAGMMAEYQVLP
jgi:FtsP/CotA-like multicopper oxidase with cupredoxin domain